MSENDTRPVDTRDIARTLASLEEAAVEPADPLVGRVIDGKYAVDRLIGVGGMGRVYGGRNLRTESPVAIKTMIPGLSADETLVRRFEIEAKSASNLRHPNTIRIFDFGREGEILFMVMELLDGQSLESVIRKERRVAPRRLIRVMRQVCGSLAEAHDSGLVHRDLKPDNIFLNRVGGQSDFVKVLDFGVAKLRNDRFGAGTLTQAGMIFGTPRYMSPEQARAFELDGRSDIYAIGVILFEALCGHPPFDAADAVGILIKHVNEPAPPLRDPETGGAFPQELDTIVRRCMEKDPARRFDDVTQLGHALEEAEQLLAGAQTRAAIPASAATVPNEPPVVETLSNARTIAGHAPLDSVPAPAGAARGSDARGRPQETSLSSAIAGGSVYELSSVDDTGPAMRSQPPPSDALGIGRPTPAGSVYELSALDGKRRRGDELSTAVPSADRGRHGPSPALVAGIALLTVALVAAAIWGFRRNGGGAGSAAHEGGATSEQPAEARVSGPPPVDSAPASAAASTAVQLAARMAAQHATDETVVFRIEVSPVTEATAVVRDSGDTPVPLPHDFAFRRLPETELGGVVFVVDAPGYISTMIPYRQQQSETREVRLREATRVRDREDREEPRERGDGPRVESPRPPGRDTSGMVDPYGP